ncbi:hypothetical protein FisN_9Lh380 [Fistulifera solaris]|uniref:histone acetyltransferase n=1 Tax=Fistulifera solaris TaxID=1519565 RepID=A0A1Z5KM91_FISSO|nr:hypothetical protein FisN_9Lh380 [Fistulifera solaris]|eukprot:GAX27058.1 hypothetical protein FisN_9Lh380 [Fistulifera solaris]
MTVGTASGGPSATADVHITRRIISSIVCREDADVEVDAKNEYKHVAHPAHHLALRRQVSNEVLSSCGSDDDSVPLKKPPSHNSASSSPVHCCHPANTENNFLPRKRLFTNPLHDTKMFEHHKRALQLEAELQPLRLILSRLMAHPIHNRKGLFNTPVDPVALGLLDYYTVITKPMDFGTIKARLHALAFSSREQVVKDIRLVLQNAMTYNPPHHIVHSSAMKLMAFFEEQLSAFCPDMALDPVAVGGSASVAAVEPSVHSNQATRCNTGSEELLRDVPNKRKKRGTRVITGHDCFSCQGRTCAVCQQGCLHLEPTLLICNGFACAGARIRKAATYYIAPDGNRQYCQKCYIGLPATLPDNRYKADLLKRKNDEETVERWLTCVKCQRGVHAVCVLHNEYLDAADTFECPECVSMVVIHEPSVKCVESNTSYTFASGEDLPVRMSDLMCSSMHNSSYTADSLPETIESAFLQCKVRERMILPDYPNAEKTVTVRVISDCARAFTVPDVIRKHFCMPTTQGMPPQRVHYRSKAIVLFQKIDGLDVCIFCMYVQEYDGQDEYEDASSPVDTKKRVYIAYIDSVEHFQPRACRTKVYQELLVSYLASARKRGYDTAHIWACPPSRGNSFVFWNHPASQRTPTRERLVAWYHDALSRAVECGVVTDIQSLYESEFQGRLEPLEGTDAVLGSKMECPPLLDGDFWVEEAVRVHQLHSQRVLRITKIDSCDKRLCPATEVANVLRDKILAHPISTFFRRPVNAAALKLKDYHDIITRPMDLGTVYSQLVLGEYITLRDVVRDVELVISNATTYNPSGNVVHVNALELHRLFFREIEALVSKWSATTLSWEVFASMSMNLDHTLPCTSTEPLLNTVAPDSYVEKTEKSLDKPEVHLLSGGADAVQRRMVGNDVWLLDKRNPLKNPQPKSNPRRRKSVPNELNDEPPAKRRRQSWLAEEVGASVRLHRTCFFSCSLTPTNEQEKTYEQYTQNYTPSTIDRHVSSSTIADMRHALLEFSQFRNLEFDTLRHAKYSSAILLFHLHHDRAPGTIPECSSCSKPIADVRWHRLSRVTERRLFQAVRHPVGRRPKRTKPYEPEELCEACHTTSSDPDDFIPIPVSFNAA